MNEMVQLLPFLKDTADMVIFEGITFEGEIIFLHFGINDNISDIAERAEVLLNLQPCDIAAESADEDFFGSGGHVPCDRAGSDWRAPAARDEIPQITDNYTGVALCPISFLFISLSEISDL